MTVKALADRVGVSPHTVRYYARIGLLAPSRRRRGGYREFDESDVHVLEFVPRAQALGFTLDEVMTIVAKSRRAESPRPRCATSWAAASASSGCAWTRCSACWIACAGRQRAGSACRTACPRAARSAT